MSVCCFCTRVIVGVGGGSCSTFVLSGIWLGMGNIFLLIFILWIAICISHSCESSASLVMKRIAMIQCYCNENLSEGIALLRHAADHNHLPSIYALALILRDTRQVESNYYLNVAATLGYAPAWQEKLTAAEMRTQFGDLDANKLIRYLDPPCLNQLIGRHYLQCSRVRNCQTSHCWNPLCGRWAYKALRSGGARDGGVGQTRRMRLRAALADNARAISLIRSRRNNNNNEGRGTGEEGSASGNAGGAASLGGAEDGQKRESCGHEVFSIESLLPQLPSADGGSPLLSTTTAATPEPSSSLEQIREALRNKPRLSGHGLKVSRMKMCSSCRRAKYCSKLCQVFDWRSGRHKVECQFL